jgi:hypothetical protein
MIGRILKLGLTAVIGYAAFQFIRGILEGEEAIEGNRRAAPRAQSRSYGELLTGGGSGRIETTEDAVGTSTPHRVGRGVVHR